VVTAVFNCCVEKVGSVEVSKTTKWNLKLLPKNSSNRELSAFHYDED
jgi:hypothetical protein